MPDFWVVGPVAWDRVLRVPHLPPSGGFVRATTSQNDLADQTNAAMALASAGASVHMVVTSATTIPAPGCAPS